MGGVTRGFSRELGQNCSGGIEIFIPRDLGSADNARSGGKSKPGDTLIFNCDPLEINEYIRPTTNFVQLISAVTWHYPSTQAKDSGPQSILTCDGKLLLHLNDKRCHKKIQPASSRLPPCPKWEFDDQSKNLQ